MVDYRKWAIEDRQGAIVVDHIIVVLFLFSFVLLFMYEFLAMAMVWIAMSMLSKLCKMLRSSADWAESMADRLDKINKSEGD
jgi:hypothetical protein